jgi:ABC-type uncharacterized transport system permease subunit
MSGVTYWIVGFLLTVLALVGLNAAASARDEMLYIAGLLIFVFAVGFNFWLIKKWFDDRERHA